MGKFFCNFIEIFQFDEAASVGVFKVAKFESVMIIELGPALVLWAPFQHNCFHQIERIMAQKNILDCGNIQFFIGTCDFLSFRVCPLIWMCCMKKVGQLFCCMLIGTCFKIFYWSIFYLVVRVHSCNSMTITELLNSGTTKIVLCAPRLSVRLANAKYMLWYVSSWQRIFLHWLFTSNNCKMCEV